MSIHAMVHYIEHEELRGNEKLLMIILANYADEKGECFPGVDRIASQLNISRRGTQSLLSKMKDSGHIEIKYNDGIRTGTGNTNRYTLVSFARKEARQGVNQRSPLECCQGVKNDAQGVKNDAQGVKNDAQGVNGGSPDPSVDPSVDPKEIKRTSSLSATGDPLLDASLAKFNRKQRSVGVSGWQAEMNLELDAKKRVPLVNKLVEICGLAMVTDANEWKLQEVHKAAVAFYRAGHTSAEDLGDLYRRYLAIDWNRTNHPMPSIENLMKFAERQKAASSGIPSLVGVQKTVGVYVGTVENLR